MSANQLQIIQAQLDALKRRMDCFEADAPSDKHHRELDTLSEQVYHLLADLDAIIQRGDKEAKLSQAQIMHQVIGDVVPDFLWTCTADEMLLYANERCTEYTGLDPLCGVPVHALIHPEDYSGVSAEWQETLESPGSHFTAEFRMRDQDGMYRWFMARAVPVRDGHGAIVQWIGTTTDIHERKRAEESLDRSYEHLQQIIETAIDSVISMDANGLIIDWNAQAEAMFGWPRQAVIGKPLSQMIIPGSRPDDRQNALNRCLIPGEGSVLKERIEICAQHRSGRRFPIELSISRVAVGDTYMFSAFVRDLTERRQFEDEINTIEDRFRATFEQAAVGIAHVATDGRWLRVNDRLCNMLGYTRSELLTLSFTDVTHPDDISIGPPVLQQLVTGEIESYVLEKRYLRKNGDTVWGMVTATIIRDPKGDPQYVASVIEDITERKQAESALRKSLRLLSTAEMVANMGSWEFDLQTNTISRSDELCRIIGVAESSQDASFSRIVDMVHPDDREPMSVLLGNAVQNREAFVCKYRCIRPDKREIVISVRGEPIQNEDGEVISLVGSTRDITLQEETDRVLAQRSRMSTLVAEVGDALTRDTSLNRTLKRCSEAVVHCLEAALVRIWLFNAELNALDLQSCAGISTTLDDSRASIPLHSHALICRVAATRECFFSNDVQRDRRMQDYKWAGSESIVSYIGIPLIVNNKLVGILTLYSRASITDIEIETMKSVADSIAVGIQRRNAEDELRKLNLELERRVDERTAQLKAAINELDAFAYSVSHDLRAPLRSIDGFSLALITEFEAQMPDKARLYLERVRKGAQRMGTLIEDLLRLSHLGRQPVNVQPVDMASILQEEIARLRCLNSDRQVEIVAADLPACQCDPTLIRLMLASILSNSFKYTRLRAMARIEVNYQVDHDEVVFAVRDNGVGFEMQYAHKLFEPFQRLHRAEEFDGSGVGLAIVRRIVTLHGGRVWAKSQPGEGAEFYFTLKGGTPGE